MKHLLVIAIMIFLVCLAVGCTHLGIADRQAMMNKWRGQDVDIELLADINAYGNWYSQGEKQYPVICADEETIKNFVPKNDKCVDQATAKESILKELGISYKIGHCTITRDNPWSPTGHRFLVASINGKEYVLDNGSIQDGIFTFNEVQQSTWGVTDWMVE